MNKKEKEIIEYLEFYMKDDMHEFCNSFFNEESNFIEHKNRSSDFFNRTEKVREWLFTGSANSINFEVDEYYRQENKITEDNNPEII